MAKIQDIMAQDIRNISEGITVKMPRNLFRKKREHLDKYCNEAFTNADRMMMADILGLDKKKKPKAESKSIVGYMPDLAVLADHDDMRRNRSAHENKINEYIQNNKSTDEEECIIVDDFDDQDMAVLELINKIIESTNKKRAFAKRKSTNIAIRE